MSVVLHLLGEPRLARDGQPLPPPRGRKPWGLLAYLLLAEHQPSRQSVAEMLFSDANDPMAALRWTLSEIRRATGWSADELGGDPLTISLPQGFSVDLTDVAQRPPQRMGGASTGALLGSLTFDALPAFEYWLHIQRLSLANRQQTQLRDEVLADIATGHLEDAVRRAHRLVELDPLEARNQEVLLRSLAVAGQSGQARQQLAWCEELFSRELQAPVPAALRLAVAEQAAPARRTTAVTSAAEARACLQAGRAAIAAGAVQRGLEQLQSAVQLTRETRDTALETEALLEYGEALARGGHDRTTQVTAILHQAIATAHKSSRGDYSARACSELAFVHIQSGDAVQAQYWLTQADEHSQGEERLAAVTHGLRGMASCDSADYAQSLESLSSSVTHARVAGRPRQVAWARSMAARTHLLRGDLTSAAHAVQVSIDIAESERWVAMLPWPQAQQGEILRRQGRLDEAAAWLETSFALGREVGDLCWVSLASRSLADLALDRGDSEAASAWTERSTEHMPPYVWVLAHSLEGKCHVAGRDAELSRKAVEQLADCADQHGLREFSARAALRLGDLGDEGAGQAARSLSCSIDNPRLQRAADSGAPL
ncbi:MAG: tetratricopeptide repeat protein [Ornithinimicrobium sp.]